MLINDFLEQSAVHRPDKIALIEDKRRWRYAEVEAKANRLANLLRQQGVKPGDRVAVKLSNSLEIIISLFGILKAGGIYTIVNAQTEPHQLAYILRDSGAVAFITQEAKLAEQFLAELPALQFGLLVGSQNSPQPPRLLDYEEALAAAETTPLPRTQTADDLASILYTSGSTGQPKGVMYTHANECAVIASIVEYLQNNENDRILNVLSLASSYGLCQVLATFMTGATLVVEPQFGFPYDIVKRLIEEEITGMAGVPSIWSSLLEIDLESYEFPHLRYITNAGSGLPAPYVERLQTALPTTRLYAMYGQTECRRVSYMPPDQINRRPKSSGIPIPGCRVWIVDEADRPLPPGQIGELAVSGPHVMPGYWHLPEKTAQKLRPAPESDEMALYTGDMFYMDEEGYLYFVSRMDDIIKIRGQKVSPIEVENTLYQLPGIIEAAVIGVSDEGEKETIKACVVTNGIKLNKGDIIRHCRDRLADYKTPHHIEFFDSLPKTATGKIHKPTLRLAEATARG